MVFRGQRFDEVGRFIRGLSGLLLQFVIRRLPPSQNSSEKYG